jgi:methylphosphotriester-DNA--protein-cysteine methyltransferase
MTYNSHEIFEAVERQLSSNPGVNLYQLARQLRCSQPTIEKAVLRHTALTFRDYKIKKLLERGIFFLQQDYKSREVGSLLGYRWSEDFLRLVRKKTGCPLRQLAQNASISARSELQGKFDA